MSALKKELGLFPARENNALYHETLRIARMGKRCIKNLDEDDAKGLAYNLELLGHFIVSLERVTNEFKRELKAVMKNRELKQMQKIIEGTSNVVGFQSRDAPEA